MSDFVQLGPITTVHDLGVIEREKLEAQVERAARREPLGLILPVTAADMRAEPFERIVAALESGHYLSRIAVVLGQTRDEADFRQARDLANRLGDRARVLWTGGQRITALYETTREAGLNTGADGKGLAVWTAFGYLLAYRSLRAFALHDCDIVNYDRTVLARLCLPMVAPGLDFEFCKGYYARVTDRMHGRVVRLLVSPILNALTAMYAPNRFLTYLESFRYPLAGEFAVTRGLAQSIRIPGDWGLEIGALSEVYRSTSVKRICQVDLGLNYEHKHQVLDAEQADKGLMKMAQDILTTIFRTLAGMGTSFNDGDFISLRSVYLRCAQDSIRRYHADAVINGLEFDRHEEEHAVEAFAQQIIKAADVFLSDPLGGEAIPNWARVLSLYPDFPERLRRAVDEDAADFNQ